MQKKYEIVYLLSSELEEKKIESLKSEIKKIIEKNEGKISQEKELGKRKLAYKIGPNYYALYCFLTFEVEKEKVKFLNRDLGLLPDILRFLITDFAEFPEIRRENPKTPLEKPISKPVSTPIKKEETSSLKTEKTETKETKKDKVIKTKKSQDLKTKPKEKKADLSQLDQKIEKILEEEIF
jgi:small subunit ribosomal protein S6